MSKPAGAPRPGDNEGVPLAFIAGDKDTPCSAFHFRMRPKRGGGEEKPTHYLFSRRKKTCGVLTI